MSANNPPKQSASAKKQAVIIATRNRPDDLERTLRSIARAESAGDLLVMIVDGSDPGQVAANQRVVANLSSLDIDHRLFPGPPSLARQRNAGIHRLPESVELVFFLDDDVILDPEYFRQITRAFDQHPDIVGVGGYDASISSQPECSLRQVSRFAFLLDHPRPGCVLPSGQASSPDCADISDPVNVQWLTGFSMAYRRHVLEQERFDASLEGYSHYEDRDLSVRISHYGRLVVLPGARLHHRKSPTNRYDSKQFTYSSLVHIYWFVEKNIQHPLRKPAFWWATIGQTLALIVSSKPQKWDALRGHLKGIATILTRDHALLKSVVKY